MFWQERKISAFRETKAIWASRAIRVIRAIRAIGTKKAKKKLGNKGYI